MLRALVTKELREVAWIALAALAAYAVILAQMMGADLEHLEFDEPVRVPFWGDDFDYLFVNISAIFAVVLGLRQSLGESLHKTWPFLLHRPVRRRTVLGAKLATGLVLSLACAGAPVLLGAWWAATPGTHAGPFEWSWTLSTWRVWFGLTVFYLAAFLCGIRDARWYGTRLLPAVPAVFLAVVLVEVHWWPAVNVGLTAVTDVLLLGAICQATRTRDF